MTMTVHTETNGSTTALATTAQPMGLDIERVLLSGDLSRLTADQRVAYYNRVCDSLDLNPLTTPFAYLKLNGKEVLYALRACTDQLRSKRRVSIAIVAREHIGDVYVVTARATTPDGRCDESTGAVPMQGLKGEALANALMKAETKAKRRVTLSICGLGMLDESEIDSIPGAQPVARMRPQVVPLDADGAEMADADVRAADLAGRIMSAESLDGLKALVLEIKSLPPSHQQPLREAYAARQASLKGGAA